MTCFVRCLLLLMMSKIKGGEKETKVLRATINIILNILDQFIHFCCSCRRRTISKVIDKKILSNKKMSNSITVRNEVQVKVIFNI